MCQDGEPRGPEDALPNLASVRIELMKGIWRLDAHLLGQSGRPERLCA